MSSVQNYLLYKFECWLICQYNSVLVCLKVFVCVWVRVCVFMSDFVYILTQTKNIIHVLGLRLSFLRGTPKQKKTYNGLVRKLETNLKFSLGTDVFKSFIVV